ncbi:hypothetical protein D3C87_1831900 [compost metagenome]
MNISTGTLIWSEYLATTERRRQSSRNSSSSARRCRMTSVPRPSLVTSATVKEPSPSDSHCTPWPGSVPAAREMTVTLSATMKAE